MVNEALRVELLAMREEDFTVREELLESGELGGEYVPRMEAEHVNELSASVGLDPLRPIPDPGPDLPEEQQRAIRESQHWWQEWLASKGWGTP